jgi:outer membrane protein assembly factor BamB
MLAMTYRENDRPSPLLIVGFGDHVFGMSLTTGERVWQRDLHGRSMRIETDGEHVYVIGNVLECLEYATGKVLWRQPDISGVFANGRTLLLHGDHVVIGDAGQVACIDARTGTILWPDEYTGLGVGPVALAVPGKAVQADLS